MYRTVKCTLLDIEAEGLDNIPYPGELGQRIYDHVSKEAWKKWLERLVIIMNEYRLNSSDQENQYLIEQHLVGFLFNEGQYKQLPAVKSNIN